MLDLDNISEELFNKIRGRFKDITIGDSTGTVTNIPKDARYFDFKYNDNSNISVSLSEKDGVVVMYNSEIFTKEQSIQKSNWYSFLKELRSFARKRLLNFDTRDITKSNLNKRDYKYLAKNSGDDNMTESKLYGTGKVSYQNVDNARIVVKHTESINQERAGGRTQKIGTIHIESAEGERFKYPYKHLNGARAMARHVAEGGNAYDDFGKHIISMSEELSKLKKFKSHMSRNGVMAEGLAEYNDAVNDRINTVKRTVETLQRKNAYVEAVTNFESTILEDVPEDVSSNWIDQLTIRQFNEELSDVFPYIYKLVNEYTKAKELSPEDLLGEKKSSPAGGPACWKGKKIGNPKTKMKGGKRVNNCVPEGTEEELVQGFEEMMGQFKETTLERTQGDEYECEFEYTGDDGETQMGELIYKVIDGKVDPKSLRGEADPTSDSNGGNAKVDDELATMQVALGGDFHEEAVEFAQECYDDEQAGKPQVGQYDNYNLKPETEDDVGEAYINNAKDAVDVLGALRGKGKKIERGQDDDQGNLANEYVGNTWDVYTWLQNKTQDFRGMDKNQKEIIDNMMKLRGEAKKLETKPGSGSNGRFGNQIVNTLYPVMELINSLGLKDDDTMDVKIDKEKGTISKDDGTEPKEQKTPLGEFILSYFDKETGEFPKGETAILTMVEKDYGEKFITPAKQFIEKIQSTVESYNMRKNPQRMESEDELPKITDEMNGMISDWIEKFSKFIGGNGDTLPDGYIQWALNSGITTDFVEQNEAEAMREKYGEDEFENDPMSEKFLNEMPITKAALEMIEKITGNDDIDTNARMIDKVQSGDADESTRLNRMKELAGLR